MSTQGARRRSPQMGSLQSQRIVTRYGLRENVAGPAATGVQVATVSSRVDVSSVSEMPEATLFVCQTDLSDWRTMEKATVHSCAPMDTTLRLRRSAISRHISSRRLPPQNRVPV